jgi:hypothetical protein
VSERTFGWLPESESTIAARRRRRPTNGHQTHVNSNRHDQTERAKPGHAGLLK